jgi:hypoxanthine phosphoribosyltransferase
MKIINGNFKEIDYPVGDHIQKNIPIINNMGVRIKSILIEKKLESDDQINLICSGSSGAIISSIIATILYKDFKGVNIRHIKKDGESSHAADNYKSHFYSSYFNGFNIIVDDFICSGDTMKRIFSKIKDDIQIDIIAISKINNGCENIIEFFKEQKVKILLRN